MAEKNLPFISVIVPFYNIEECVTYCLDSLVAQDYEGEYEILCVDDGSTDGTPAALDTYAAEHPRVKVLHKPNGGQSDARNFGVEHAGGDYITFVDGDDFVSACYLSSLMRALISEGAPIPCRESVRGHLHNCRACVGLQTPCVRRRSNLWVCVPRRLHRSSRIWAYGEMPSVF